MNASWNLISYFHNIRVLSKPHSCFLCFLFRPSINSLSTQSNHSWPLYLTCTVANLITVPRPEATIGWHSQGIAPSGYPRDDGPAHLLHPKHCSKASLQNITNFCVLYMFVSIETNFKESISKFQIPYLEYYIVIYNILCTYYYLCYYIIITYVKYYVQKTYYKIF